MRAPMKAWCSDTTHPKFADDPARRHEMRAPGHRKSGARGRPAAPSASGDG